MISIFALDFFLVCLNMILTITSADSWISGIIFVVKAVRRQKYVFGNILKKHVFYVEPIFCIKLTNALIPICYYIFVTNKWVYVINNLFIMSTIEGGFSTPDLLNLKP